MRLVPERNEQNSNDPTIIEVDSTLIRDLFAAAALIKFKNDYHGKGIDPRSSAKFAYEMADAMMKERAGGDR